MSKAPTALPALNLSFTDAPSTVHVDEGSPAMQENVVQQTAPTPNSDVASEKILRQAAKSSPRTDIRVNEAKAELAANVKKPKRVNLFIDGERHKLMRLFALKNAITSPEVIEMALDELFKLHNFKG